MRTGKIGKIKAIFVSFPQRQNADVVPGPVPSIFRSPLKMDDILQRCTRVTAESNKLEENKKGKCHLFTRERFEHLGIKNEATM